MKINHKSWFNGRRVGSDYSDLASISGRGWLARKEMRRRVGVSAPGKVILHGEHAVVYGKEAIACSIEKRVTCLLEVSDSSNLITIRATSDNKTNEKSFELSAFLKWQAFVDDVSKPRSFDEEQLKDLQKLIGAEDDASVEAKLYLVCMFYYLAICSKFLKGSGNGLVINISSELPLGAGLGSSASVCVSLSCAFLALCCVISTDSHQQKDISQSDLQLVNSWAFEGEKILHGTPSGIDNSVVTFGGLVSFKKGVITNLPWSPHLEILLVYSKVPRSTKDLVKGVRDRREKMPRVYDALFDAIECLVQESKSNLLALEDAMQSEKNYEKCIQIMDRISDMVDINQNILRSIGVSHDSIESILMILRRFGLKGKLTGAGGGGCVFALVKPGQPEMENEATKELAKSGYSCWRVRIGGSGVKFIEPLNICANKPNE
ncbi:mevalonate kinase-like [Rhopilema esculentum]|uniref:mevalonate kinase-like n=1 Tax=Rhopilema esculentum TaxID=499914 RepID=UPI0031DCE810